MERGLSLPSRPSLLLIFALSLVSLGVCVSNNLGCPSYIFFYQTVRMVPPLLFVNIAVLRKSGGRGGKDRELAKESAKESAKERKRQSHSTCRLFFLVELSFLLGILDLDDLLCPTNHRLHSLCSTPLEMPLCLCTLSLCLSFC